MYFHVFLIDRDPTKNIEYHRPPRETFCGDRTCPVDPENASMVAGNCHLCTVEFVLIICRYLEIPKLYSSHQHICWL